MSPSPGLPASLPVSAPPRVRDRLRAAPDGPVRVVHRGRDAVYVDLDGWCLGVVSAAASAVPCALRSRNADLGAVAGRSAYVRAGVLHLDGTPLVVGRVLRVSAPRLDPRASGTTASPITQVIPPTTVVGLVAPLGLVGRPLGLDDVAHLVGRGDGLTPSGDDLLCGWLAAHRATGEPTPEVDEAVRALLPATTLLSATLLDCALHGEVLPQFSAWLAALGTPAEADRAAVLESVGHSSGAALLYGARLALASLPRPPISTHPKEVAA
ncbi:hypothetical protein FB382_000711 [Nocardioides ginsengisegetis]|uniref:DUF2877 domain-containing protein n=1 Tax=Nocardioides ginsengisegetis TaxID=661491 RepID=A0A7W3IXE6_9ACTN|nr:hypothetical protein [Nocardioides ginsengisegetis]